MNPPAIITLDCSDEQVILYLDGFKPGSLLPKNVLGDINPFHYSPSNLPGGLWYMIQSTEKKENEYGFWEVKEEASEVFTNSSISGWRTTLEYFEFVDCLERRTDWVMQEYRITQKGKCGVNKEKELRTMCRIFLSKSKAAGNGGKNDSPTVPLITPSIDSRIFGNDSTSGSLMRTAVNGTTLLYEDGDFLELDDLADPLSHSSSSDNSGRTSMTFDDFDPIALLEALEDNNNQGQKGKESSSRCSVTAPIRTFEVVMQPAPSRPLVCATVRQQPSGCNQASSITGTKFVDERSVNQSVKKQKAGQRNEGPSFSQGMVASSSTASTTVTPIPKGKKKAAVVKTKRLKKYFCFLPF